MNKVAHNISTGSYYNDEQSRWLHNLSVVISDMNTETQKIDKSEQFNMIIAPAMEPSVLIEALRSLTDSLEQYITTGKSS